jgi:acylphosphatase
MNDNFAVIVLEKDEKLMVLADGTEDELNSLLSTIQNIEPAARVVKVDKVQYEESKRDIKELNELLRKDA